MKPFEDINFATYLDDRPEEGILRVDRAIFTDPDIFELEMERIWSRSWLYICHESQVANPNDYFTTHMGRQPVIVARNAQGKLNVFINACAHRGSKLVRECQGNRADYTCGFHGWCFNSNGDLVSVMKQETGGYPDNFDKQSYALTKVPRVESYRGFVFASLADSGMSLKEHLRDSTIILELMADQGGEDGLEVVKGFSTYTFNGNWKAQAENGVDGYHAYQTHLNFMLTTKHREKILAERDKIKSMDISNIHDMKAGYFDFGHGHVTLWSDWADGGERRPNFHRLQEWSERYGAVRAKWMVQRLRNSLFYPNMLLMDQMSSQIRVFRPIAVDLTEVTIYALAPKNEEPEHRAHRLRQYEDFFNISGMATPDDVAEFNYSQEGFQARNAKWSDMTRGHKLIREGATEDAEELGIQPNRTGLGVDGEGIVATQHHHWLHLMTGK